MQSDIQEEPKRPRAHLGHGGGGDRGRTAPPKPRPTLPVLRGAGSGAEEALRSRSAPVLGWGSPSWALADPRSQPRALRDPAGGHGDSAPLATSCPRARAGMAASAAERSGPGPRLPAPPRLPGSGLLAGGERSRAERGCPGRRGWWGGRRRVVRRCQMGRSAESRRLCEGADGPGSSEPGRLTVRPRD